MANAVADEDERPESDLNEMTMEWEKGGPGNISRRVGQFSRAGAGQFWRALKVEPLKNVNARTWAPIQSGKVCVRVASAYE